MKRLIYGLFAVVLLSAASFDTASIKPSPPGSTGSDSDGDNGYLRMRNVTLKRCIRIAFGFSEVRILEGPKWLDESHFDIIARSSEPVTDIRPLLQALLADRFHLKLHHETRPLSGFALTVAKGGAKMKVSPVGTDTVKPNTRTGTPGPDGKGRTDNFGHVTMSQFAMRLADQLGAPVEDATGLAEVFGFALTWSPEDTQVNATGAEFSQGLSLFTALQEQLGLKLEPRKVPTDMLIVDHAELPSEN